MGRKSPKLPLSPLGDPSNTWLFGPTAPHTQNAISIEPAVSSGLTLDYPYILLWDGSFPSPTLPFPLGGQDPHLIHGYCGPLHPICQTASRSVQPFCRIPRRDITDTQTADRPTHGPRHTSVAIGRIYAMHTMRPKKVDLRNQNM